MGIKWEDVHIGASPLTGQIYVGKLKNYTWTDKSGDRSTEVVAAVVEKLLATNKDSISIRTKEKEYQLKLVVTDIKGEDDGD